MALAPLATAADLTARNITLPTGADIDTLLAAASASVREAAGCAISQTTSTVTLVATEWRELDLPAGPVASVAAVQVGGVDVTGWSKVGDTLHMPYGWTQCLPVEVTVTYTHGLPVVPEDIVDLVCGVANIAGQSAADGNYGASQYDRSIRLGEYAETYFRPDGTVSPSPTALPDGVREKLRARFGTNTAVIRVAR